MISYHCYIYIDIYIYSIAIFIDYSYEQIIRSLEISFIIFQISIYNDIPAKKIIYSPYLYPILSAIILLSLSISIPISICILILYFPSSIPFIDYSCCFLQSIYLYIDISYLSIYLSIPQSHKDCFDKFIMGKVGVVVEKQELFECDLGKHRNIIVPPNCVQLTMNPLTREKTIKVSLYLSIYIDICI